MLMISLRRYCQRNYSEGREGSKDVSIVRGTCNNIAWLESFSFLLAFKTVIYIHLLLNCTSTVLSSICRGLLSQQFVNIWTFIYSLMCRELGTKQKRGFITLERGGLSFWFKTFTFLKYDCLILNVIFCLTGRFYLYVWQGAGML